jgi:hypothetical protein
MKAASDQPKKIFLDLEKPMGVQEEGSEKLETQLKVLLVRYSGDRSSNDLVVRTAKTLASCLRTRGDLQQAEQYAQMAANLELRDGGPRQPAAELPVQPQVQKPRADAALPTEKAEVSGPDQFSSTPAPRSGWRARWDAWFAAWDWVLKRKRQ